MKTWKFLALSLLMACTSREARPQLHFIGFTNVIGDKVDVVFRNNNYGTIRTGDTLCILDVACRHLYVVEGVFADSIADKNFLGGEFEDDHGSLTYFSRRLEARYAKTLPHGNYILSREIGEFFVHGNFFLCVKFRQPIHEIAYLRQELLRADGITYDFTDRVIVDNSNRKQDLRAFYKVRLRTTDWSDIIILEDKRNETHYRVFADQKQVADILVGINTD